MTIARQNVIPSFLMTFLGAPNETSSSQQSNLEQLKKEISANKGSAEDKPINAGFTSKTKRMG